MRILIIGSTYYPQINGQSVFTQNLAEGLARLGHDVMVIFASDTEKAYEYERKGVRIQAIPSIHLSIVHPGLFVAHSYRRIVQSILASFNPEIVHCQDSAPLSQYVIKKAHQRHIKVVGTNHPGPEIWAPYFSSIAFLMKLGLDSILWGWILKFLNQSDFVTVPSRAASRLLKQHGLKTPVRAISCGVDLDRFKPLPTLDREAVRSKYGLDPAKKVFLYIGRLDTEKKVDSLIKSAAYIPDPEVQIGIAGAGAETNLLQTLAFSMGAAGRVHFIGPVQHDDLPSLLNAADVFVMPGDVESLSIATLEAMACALPVVAANSMALPELVQNGENGYLFKPRDPQDIARCIDLMASHPEKWAGMGNTSLARVSRHGITHILYSYEQVFHELAGVNKPVIKRKRRSGRARQWSIVDFPRNN